MKNVLVILNYLHQRERPVLPAAARVQHDTAFPQCGYGLCHFRVNGLDLGKGMSVITAISFPNAAINEA